jgi:hypothetical protein
MHGGTPRSGFAMAATRDYGAAIRTSRFDSIAEVGNPDGAVAGRILSAHLPRIPSGPTAGRRCRGGPLIRAHQRQRHSRNNPSRRSHRRQRRDRYGGRRRRNRRRRLSSDSAHGLIPASAKPGQGTGLRNRVLSALRTTRGGGSPLRRDATAAKTNSRFSRSSDRIRVEAARYWARLSSMQSKQSKQVSGVP